MKALTKAQSEAIVDEIQDRLRELIGPSALPQRVEAEWATLKAKITELGKMETEENKMEEKLEELKDQRREFEKEIKHKVNAFESRHTLEVDWQYVNWDEGEEPTVKLPVRDFKDKISRQIQILSIDKGGPLTADDLIESVVKKLSKS